VAGGEHPGADHGDECSVWSEEVGEEDAPLVVLIHGSMDRSSGMLKLSRALGSHSRVLRYDRRGYGRSALCAAGHGEERIHPHPGPFDIGAQVDDLVSLLAGRAAVLVGHSYGGNVALATAARHPHLVRSIAIYETPLSWEPWWPGTTAGSVAAAGSLEPGEAAERFMRRLIGDVRWEALPERTRSTRRREGSAMVGELADLRQHQPWTAADINVPVRAGYGSGGAAHHQRGMRHVGATVKGAVVVELPGCRHDAPLSHPVLFAKEMVLPLVR
jgi:pimeloyl-ACP methyl ester carboxylesterase